MRVKVVRVNRGGQEDIISDETIQLQHGQFPPAQTPGVDDWLVECVDTIMCTGGNHQFILTIEVLGTGGPGSIEIGGETIDFPYNFANVVKVEIDTEP